MAKRANGEGSIRRRPDGTWEGRLTINGKQRSVYGKTQAEVRLKMRNLQKANEACLDLAASEMTVSEWLSIWMRDYRNSIKESTKATYWSDIKLHILPYIGKIKLSALTSEKVQRMYNKLVADGISPKSVRNTHGILHKALDQAVKLKYIAGNVSDNCEIAVGTKKEMQPIKDGNLRTFLEMIKGNRCEDMLLVAVFTGMRESEIIGLSWDCIDFERKQIRIYRQLSKERKKGGAYVFSDLKNKKARSFSAADVVFDTLMRVRQAQERRKSACSEEWNNSDNLVFTDARGKHICTNTLYMNFKRVVRGMGMSDVRFHDLRHTFATLSIEAGNDIKTISTSLGHATTAFTMDVYGHVSDKMQRESAQRMQAYLSNLL